MQNDAWQEVATEADIDALNQAGLDLKNAYRRLDQNKKRLRQMKKNAYENEEDMKYELGDVGFFRLRELQDQLTYEYQELAELKAKEA